MQQSIDPVLTSAICIDPIRQILTKLVVAVVYDCWQQATEDTASFRHLLSTCTARFMHSM
jgi:hypothetical protein